MLHLIFSSLSIIYIVIEILFLSTRRVIGKLQRDSGILYSRIGIRKKLHLDKSNIPHTLIWNGYKFVLITKEEAKIAEV